MRTTVYGILEKATGKVIYTSYHREKAADKLQELGEGFELRYKFKSF
ncbi:MAG: hypothetical protein IKU44_04480 [Firmicutes bacterium]|nr:hypothetical protein [Bacillota bacterium]